MTFQLNESFINKNPAVTVCHNHVDVCNLQTILVRFILVLIKNFKEEKTMESK